MTNRRITSDSYFKPPGPFAPAILATGANILSISGQVALSPAGDLVGPDDAEAQARCCFENIDKLVTAAGGARTDIVKVTVILTDLADRAAVARARTAYFGSHEPASTLIVAGLVAPEFKVEIEATAIF